MRWYANELGYGDNADYWGLVGLLHDVDFEKYPDQHCKKAPELLKEINADADFIHSVVCHGYGLCVDIKPEHQMEKILFAADELTGLIWAAAKMRPSKSTQDMEVKSIKKKFKDKSFAAGCSRDVIKAGAELLGWDLNDLFEKTILAMRSCEENVRKECFAITGVHE
jgi:predicted hydrolase (HD superfamily)